MAAEQNSKVNEFFMSIEKINAAKAALTFVKDGMIIGLGTGSTAKEFIKLLAERIKAGLNISCVATSLDSERFARDLGIRITDFNEVDRIDIAVDGADVLTKRALLKGGGGALTREKIVDYTAKEFIVIADSSKIKEQLEGIVVLEVLPFAYKVVLRALEKYSKNPQLRLDANGAAKISDNGNYLIDCQMVVRNPKATEAELNDILGVIENGIFTKFDRIIIGTKDSHFIL